MNLCTGRMYGKGRGQSKLGVGGVGGWGGEGHSIEEGMEAGISPTSAGTSGVIPAQRSQKGLPGALDALERGLCFISSRKPDDA